MDNQRLYLSPPFISDEEVLAVTNTLKSGWVAPVGKEIRAFEEQLQHKFGFFRVLCLQSGTAALHLAVKLAGVQRGDTVLIGTFTFIAAANAVLYEGGIPIFLDSDQDSWNLDPDLLQDQLHRMSRAGQLPKAVILTHIFGKPGQGTAIETICSNYGVKLIDDAAEALGARYKGRYVGGFGDYGVLSFNGNKILTTGGGGALICQNNTDYEKAKYWATQSRESVSWYLHQEVGYNYRLSNVLAGLGMAQLRRFDTLLKRKREILNYYANNLPDAVFEFPTEIVDGISNCWLTSILIKKELLHKIKPEQVLTALDAENIEARMFWKPLHCQPLFKGAAYYGEGRVSQDLFHRGICLPSGVGMTLDNQKRVIQCINNLLKMSHLT